MKMNKFLALIAIALSGLFISSCQDHIARPAMAVVNPAPTVTGAVIQKSPNDDRTYGAVTLPNQLQVVLVSDPSLENAAASLAVGVGSAQDPDSQPGLAHYLEHMLFLGTQKYPIPDSFFEFVQANAGMSNAFTAFDKTNYHFQVNAGKFDEALDRFSDYFKAPTLDPLYADKERNAVNSEWSMNRSQDNWILHILDGVTANSSNPQARFNIGNLETLADKKDSVLQDEVKAFYNRYYSANNMRLTLVGSQSIAELTTLAEKYFSPIRNKNIMPPKVSVPGLTPAEMGKNIYYQSLKDIKKLYVDFPIKNNKDQWRVKPNEFVNNLITSEEEGTLCEQLRTQGFANSVTAYVNPDEYGADGYLRIEADLTGVGLKNPDRVIASVFAYVDLIKKQGANELYFRELKAMKAKDFESVSKPDPLKQAIGLTMDQFDLPIENLLNADFVYEVFNVEAINKVLEQLRPANARIWYISNDQVADKTIPYFEGKYAIRDITAEEQLRWSALASKLTFNLPPQNTLFTDKPADIVENKYLKPKQVISQKGVEAFLAHPEFYREDKGVLTVELNVNFAKKSAKNVVLSNVLSDIFKNKNMTITDRAERASLGIAIAPSASNSQAFTITGYTTKHEELLSQLLDGFVDLKVTEKDFVEALDRFKQAKENSRKLPPFKQAFGHTMRLLGDALWTEEELLVAAKKVSLRDLFEYHRAVKADVFIRLFAFGNYDEAKVQHIANTAYKKLPGKRLPEQRTIAKFITPKLTKNIMFKDSVEQTDSALVDVYLGDKRSDNEKAALVVLNSIYQNIFFSQLRTNEQLGYVVGSSAIPVDDYPGFVMYVQSTNTDLVGIKTRMDKFRTEFMGQLKSIDPAQIEQFKRAEVASVLQKPTDFYAEAKRYPADFWAAHYNFDARWRYLAALEKVDRESLIALYQKMLLDKKSMNMLIQLRGTVHADKPFVAVAP
ncbi:MAG: insulinase family protein [Pseudomonadota bacterium]